MRRKVRDKYHRPKISLLYVKPSWSMKMIRLNLCNESLNENEKQFPVMPVLREAHPAHLPHDQVKDCSYFRSLVPSAKSWVTLSNLLSPPHLLLFQGEYVAQFKFTVLLMANGPLRITSGSFDPELYKSEHEVQDPELKVRKWRVLVSHTELVWKLYINTGVHISGTQVRMWSQNKKCAV